MASIYNISAWSTSTTYEKNAIVLHDGRYFYSLANSNLAKTPEVPSTNWGGYSTLTGITKPSFIWSPSYNFSVDTEPLVRSIRFGEGYEQRLKEGINNSLIKIDFSFEKRSLKESTAIIHFFSERDGAESFIFSVPEPYNVRKLFVVRSWNLTQTFVNNYSIKANFEEVPF
jgi:phage-related protein